MPELLKQAIKNEAHRLGFTLAGVTTPDPPPHYPVYQAWIASGRHAEMGYLARESALRQRADPRRILPQCRSILVLGMHYSDPGAAPSQPTRPARGRIASYAWGQDYHDLLSRRLEQLAAFVQLQLGRALVYRAYTDTGPILERDLAQRAGLGWIGRNTCLIAPGIGSYLFLAELLLDLELPADPPFASDHCGTCSRCIQACPTGCILPDRTLDARRCIAYLTIELKGEIPAELRPRVGNWVFGCDLCQMACPWNRFAAPPGDPLLAPPGGAPQPILAEEVRLTPQTFNHRFRSSPIRRARRRGYLRNIAVSLGNAGDPSGIPALEEAAQDAEELVRQHAAWALETIRSRKG